MCIRLKVEFVARQTQYLDDVEGTGAACVVALPAMAVDKEESQMLYLAKTTVKQTWKVVT